MKNYQKQNGCHNCQRCFIFREYEEGNRYYCTFDAATRPLCGSVAMNESFFNFEEETTLTDDELQKTSDQISNEFSKHLDKWDSWSKDRQVESFGICDNHERKTP